MAELSPEGEELVHAGRQADLPSDADRERVRRALEARLGVVVGGATGAAGSARPRLRPAARGALARWLSIGLAGLAGAGLLYALHRTGGVHGSTGPSAAATVASALPTGMERATASVEPSERAVAPASPTPRLDEAPRGAASPEGPEGRRPAPSNNARPSGGAREPSSLSEEVALLSRAETDLHAGRFESALRSLDEHERRFPHGALEQDRMAARAQALCALGRTAEAQAPLERLARTAPNSPNEERARQACRNAPR